MGAEAFHTDRVSSKPGRGCKPCSHRNDSLNSLFRMRTVRSAFAPRTDFAPTVRNSSTGCSAVFSQPRLTVSRNLSSGGTITFSRLTTNLDSRATLASLVCSRDIVRRMRAYV